MSPGEGASCRLQGSTRENARTLPATDRTKRFTLGDVPWAASAAQRRVRERHLVAVRRVLSLPRDVFGLPAKRDPRVSERTTLYLRDVYDHLVGQRQGNKGEPWVKAAGGAGA